MDGWVYLFTNQAMPGLVKVGYTTRHPNARAVDLDGSGVPHPYRVNYAVFVAEPRQLEHQVHRALSEYKEKKEWFRCSVEQAISVLDQKAGLVQRKIVAGQDHIIRREEDGKVKRRPPTHSKDEKAQIISVINYKGGVGKTTLTANLAAGLASRGKRVLLLDMDAQCSLTFSFISPDEWQSAIGGDGTVGSDKTIKSWFDGIGDDDVETPGLGGLIVPSLEAAKYLGNKGGKIDLIPSHLGLINVDLDLAYMLSGVPPNRVGRQRAKVYGLLRSHLGQYVAEAKYDIVLIDCPPNFNIVTKNAIVASDGILIPAKPDYLSTLGIDYLVRNYGELVEEFNTDLGGAGIHPKILGVVFTMIQIYGGSPISAQRDYMQLRSSIPVFSSRIRENKSIFADAPEDRIPVVLQSHHQSPYSDIVSEIESLTTEFCKKAGMK